MLLPRQNTGALNEKWHVDLEVQPLKVYAPLTRVVASFLMLPSHSWQGAGAVWGPACSSIPSCSSRLRAQGRCNPRSLVGARHDAFLA